MPVPAVPTVTLPNGTSMPLLGLGTWEAEGDEVERAVLDALEIGYRHVDTATMYGNEAEVGRALRASGVDRDDVFVTTKLRPSDAGRADEVVEQSLRLLGIEQLDLWLIHWPPSSPSSAQTWERLVAARERGLVREIGVSNYDLAQIDELERATGVRPAVNQVEWGPMLHDAQTLEEHRNRGVVLEGYSPFKTTDLDDPTLVEIAAAHGRTSAQVVLRWHLQHGVVAIPKSVRRERLVENLDVLGFELTDTEMAEVDALGG